MKIPFRHAGRRGVASVSCRPSRGAVESGFDILGGERAELPVAGFPTMRARVSYSGTGYRRFFGWVQIVELDFFRDGRARAFVDVPPSMIGLGLPFAALGECPTLFDSPATDSPRPGFFSAESYLCAVSMVDRKEPIRPLAAFRWGYELDSGLEIRRRAPARLPLGSWNSRRPLLRKICPRWSYARVK